MLAHRGGQAGTLAGHTRGTWTVGVTASVVGSGGGDVVVTDGGPSVGGVVGGTCGGVMCVGVTAVAGQVGGTDTGGGSSVGMAGSGMLWDTYGEGCTFVACPGAVLTAALGIGGPGWLPGSPAGTTTRMTTMTRTSRRRRRRSTTRIRRSDRRSGSRPS